MSRRIEDPISEKETLCTWTSDGYLAWRGSGRGRPHLPGEKSLLVSSGYIIFFQGDIDDPDFPDRCQKMFDRLSNVLDNSKYLGRSRCQLLTALLPRKTRCDKVRAVELGEGDVQPAERCSGEARPARPGRRRCAPRARDPLSPDGGRPGEQAGILTKKLTDHFPDHFDDDGE